MLETHKNLVRQWFEQVWNQKSEAAIDRLFHAKGRVYGFPDPDSILVGPEQFKPVHRNFCAAFPDLHLDLEEVIGEDDRVAARWKVTMTHTGDHLGFPASGRKIVLSGSSFIVSDGKQIVVGWNHMDIGSMFQKLQAP